MTIAGTKRYALGLCGAAGVLAAITSVALIASLLTTPDQVATAMGQRDVEAILGLVADRLIAAVRTIAQYLYTL